MNAASFGVGHNSGVLHELDEKRVAIHEFVERVKGERRLADALSAADFCAMDSSGRLSAMKKIRLDMLVRLHALDPTLDVDASIAILIVDLSDNEYGCSNITVARLASLLSRDVRTIHRAIKRLDERMVLIRERAARGAVRPNTYRPYIVRSLADTNTTLKSVMDAYAPRVDPRSGGRPRKLNDVSAMAILQETYATDAVAMLSENRPDTSCRIGSKPTGHMESHSDENLYDTIAKPMRHLESHKTLKGISKPIITSVRTEERSGEEVASPSAQPASHDRQFELDSNSASDADVSETDSTIEVVEPEVIPLKPARGTKRKRAATGKRPWDWVHENEKRELFERCKNYAGERSWSQEFLSDRLKAFSQFQSSRRVASADWWAEIELWLGNPSHQPRNKRSARPSAHDIADDVFAYKD